LKWINPIDITEDGTYTIEPSFVTEQVYRLSCMFPEGEYLLIENRQAAGGWDIGLGSNGGGIVRSNVIVLRFPKLFTDYV
jgi:hypothetical protein